MENVYIKVTVNYKVASDFVLEIKNKTREELDLTEEEFNTLVKFYTHLLEVVNIFKDMNREEISMCYLFNDTFLIVNTLYRILLVLMLQNKEFKLMNLIEKILISLLNVKTI